MEFKNPTKVGVSDTPSHVLVLDIPETIKDEAAIPNPCILSIGKCPVVAQLRKDLGAAWINYAYFESFPRSGENGVRRKFAMGGKDTSGNVHFSY